MNPTFKTLPVSQNVTTRRVKGEKKKQKEKTKSAVSQKSNPVESTVSLEWSPKGYVLGLRVETK